MASVDALSDRYLWCVSLWKRLGLSDAGLGRIELFRRREIRAGSGDADCQPSATQTSSPTTGPSASPSPTSPSASPTASPTQTRTPTPTPTPSTSPSTSTSPTATPTATQSPGTSVLNLPRVPWDGGPAYWAKFPNAKKGGWDQDTFFPIGVWFGNFSVPSEIAFDKSKGINTYVGMWEGTDFNLFPENGVYWLGTGLKNQDNNSGSNPGYS